MIAPRRSCVALIDHNRRAWLWAKHLNITNAIGDVLLDLISFRGEKPPQNLPRSTLVLDDPNLPHRGRPEFGYWNVQGGNNLFLLPRGRVYSRARYHRAASSKTCCPFVKPTSWKHSFCSAWKLNPSTFSIFCPFPGRPKY